MTSLVDDGSASSPLDLLAASRVPASMLVLSESGATVAFANSAFADLTGHTLAELQDRSLTLLFGRPSDRSAFARIEQAVAAGGTVEEDLLCTRKDGASFWGRLYVAPYGTGAILQVVDVTRRVDAEGALALSQQREALGLLTNSVAHEFNNFLQILIGYIDGLKRRLGDRPEPFVQRALIRSTEAAERAAVLTRQLLSYSRRIAPEVRAVDLDALVSIISAQLRANLSERIKLDVKTSESLPAALCNPLQVDLALRYLVANAVEAMPSTGSIEIATFAIAPGDRSLQRPSEGAVGITVRDDGHGMSPEMATRALAPFATSREAGRGAGLAIVHGLMKRQNGTISFDSRPGEGTTVRLVFPVGV